MKNSTLHRFGGAGSLVAQSIAAIITFRRNLFTTQNCRLLIAGFLLLLGSAGNKALAITTTYYYPSSVTAGSNATYCVGATAAALTGTAPTAGTTTAPSASVSWTWYYNTSGATGTLAGATAVTSGTYTAGAAAASIPLAGTSISTATAGVYYYFIYLTYTSGAGSGTLYSNLVTITVNDAGTLSGPSSLCVGSTGSFSSTATGGTWSASSGIASIDPTGLATGLSQGVTSIIYNVSGCTSSATLTVNAAPVAITGTPVACPGTTTSLADASTGGTWSSSIPGTATVDAAGLVTGVAAGTTTIVYDNSCGTPASVVVTINPIPPAITPSNPTVCNGGGTVTVSDPSAGGTWSSSNSAVAPVATTGINTGQITGLVVGTANITYTLLGCNISTVVTVEPLPGPILGALNECQATSITLSDAIGGGTWSSTTPSVAVIDPVTGVVTGISGGTTIIIYTNACGSDSAVDVSIPAPDSLIGPYTACVGATTTFADVTLGGTWSSSNTSVATVLSGSGIVTGVSGGTAIITYTIPPGCSNSRLVSINPAPAAIGGTKQVCPGATTTLTNSLHGFWTSAQTYIASVGYTTGIVTGIIPDTANITFTDSAGCSIGTTVTVNPAPEQITGGITTCASSTDTVFDATPGGTWSSSNHSIATIDPIGVITTITGGTSLISYTIGDGCAATKVVTVNTLPAATVTYDFATNSFFTDTFYVSYQWYDSLQGLIPGATSYQTAALYNGNYWVVVTDTNGCMASGTPVHYNINMVGVQNQAATLLRVYPNPVTNMLYIESSVRVRAVISSIDGKTEMEQADAKEINTSSLANGMYFISLYNDSGVRLMVQKIIKQ